MSDTGNTTQSSDARQASGSSPSHNTNAELVSYSPAIAEANLMISAAMANSLAYLNAVSGQSDQSRVSLTNSTQCAISMLERRAHELGSLIRAFR
ncbi:MAG: RebB family R body protein [Paracoccus sp. (in: a-proteobacteria)]